MLLRPNLAIRALSLALVLSAAASSTASAQVVEPGTVLFQTKLSRTSGGPPQPHLQVSDQFGRAVASLGDLDGDGFGDIAVGTHNIRDGGTTDFLSKVGGIWILFLRGDGTIKAGKKLSAATEPLLAAALGLGDEFGAAVAPLGDFDGDGVMDLVVGSRSDDDGGANKGAIYFLYLNTDGSLKGLDKISSTVGNLPPGTLDIGDEWGRGMASLGDLDGDGVIELAVCATLDDDGGLDRGAVYILFLNANATVKSLVKISDTQGGFASPLSNHNSFGMAVANIGDLDEDGTVDLCVGAIGESAGGIQTGSCYILFLNPDGTVKSERRIDARSPVLGSALSERDQFGFSCAGVGDINGDGHPDVAVGCILDDDGSPDQKPDYNGGAVYILFLDTDGSVLDYTKISNTQGGFSGWNDKNDWWGSSVALLGDQNGDGNPDLLAGARFDDDGGLDMGAVFALFLSYGSPQADFRLQEEAGLTATFDDRSIGRPTAWAWDLGDGATSTEQDPEHTYAAPGPYFVTLTATNANGVGTKSAWVNIGDFPPLTDFTADVTSGYAPLTVSFQNLTLGEVTNRAWVFGDGRLSSLDSPVHVYEAPGSYTVRLTCQGPHGSDVVELLDYITVMEPPPVAAFASDRDRGVPPLDVQFTDLSTGTITSWLWDFGDGSTSTEAAPLHTYLSDGMYTVGLTVTGPSGIDMATRVDAVEVDQNIVIADFSAAPTAGFAPLLVNFDDVSTPNVTSWFWDFGDGGTSLLANPGYTYTSSGTFSVTLTTTSPGDEDSITITDLIVVEDAPPVADFSAAPSAGQRPLSVAFTDGSANAVTSWIWDFGDGVASMARNPNHTYELAGTYSVGLTVTGPGGTDVRTQTDLITVNELPPVAAFGATPTTGQAPLTVTFTDASQNPVTTWLWDFGDGSSSTEQNPEHVYLSGGIFTVTLTVDGPGGSDATTSIDLLSIDEAAPVASFTGLPTSGALPLDVAFTDTSSNPVTSWSWDFGDGGSSSAQHPQHTYTTAGTYTVSLTATGPGGVDTAQQADLVTVDEAAPVASFTGLPTSGVLPLDVAFTDTSTNPVTSWSWDFGDGGSSSAQHPQHTYTTAGTYTVALTAVGPGGSDTSSLVDFVVVEDATPPVAAFELDPHSGTAPLAVAFSDLSSGNVTSWSWDFGDGSGSNGEQPVHAYTEVGLYSVSLTVQGPGGVDMALLPDAVDVALFRGLRDPSFEESLGDEVSAAWTVLPGSSVLARSTDGLAGPPDGSYWCQLSTDGTNAATPPSNPGGFGAAPIGGSGISQEFFLPSGRPILSTSVRFPGNDTQRPDWFSLDVTDGVSVFNLFYTDSSLPPLLDGVLVGGDLGQLFPEAGPDTIFAITAQVGNADDGAGVSFADVDDFRFRERDFRSYGCGINPPGSLFVEGSVEIGEAIDFLGRGSAIGWLTVTVTPHPSFPCGAVLPQGGLFEGPGELLLIPNQKVAFLRGLPLPDDEVRFQLGVPTDPVLVGVDFYAQAILFDTTAPLLSFGLTEAWTWTARAPGD